MILEILPWEQKKTQAMYSLRPFTSSNFLQNYTIFIQYDQLRIEWNIWTYYEKYGMYNIQ